MAGDRVDFRKSLKALYGPTNRDFALVSVPRLNFIMHDGAGDPNSAESYQLGLKWLYGASYALKFASKAAGRDYVVPPLEALWWADDMTTFTRRAKAAWQWTQMLMVPDWLGEREVTAAIDKAAAKLGERPKSLRFEALEEGLCAQVLHVGSYDDEGPILKRLHEDYLPEAGLRESGHHHEIYLSDPRRVVPAKLRTVLRQPVARK